jgi:diphthamide biosynthesis protein 2
LVGKPNAAKLANFPEIDVFVIVACPLNSIELAVGNISEGRDRSGKDYFKPTITPFELDVALNPERKWTSGEFKANFRSILPGERDYVEFKGSGGGGDEEDENED